MELRFCLLNMNPPISVYHSSVSSLTTKQIDLFVSLIHLYIQIFPPCGCNYCVPSLIFYYAVLITFNPAQLFYDDVILNASLEGLILLLRSFGYSVYPLHDEVKFRMNIFACRILASTFIMFPILHYH